ncbi:hypothetical protein [Estrella lausannensis]|uniref:Uncharacterized protein n=1 Tax=Estrella lausannensis TaxID=483423 RepID=A0A0H5DNM7_9BACT|nr:hypothetical protein [Estrella lausannensis]CRX37971.1 hypothetical protein ELAC_0617 [Estrella lausannensis]
MFSHAASLTTYRTEAFECISDEESLESAKIVVFLTNHKAPSHYPHIWNILSGLKLKETDVLLAESMKVVGTWKIAAATECWENPQTLKQVEEQRKKYLYASQVIDKLQDEQTAFRRKMIACEILMGFKEADSLKGRGVDLATIGEWLKTPSVNQAEIHDFQLQAKQIVDLAYRAFCRAIISETFPERQTELITKIQKSLDRSRVFVICGASHGSPEHSDFPEEAKRLQEYLLSVGSFALCRLLA